MLFLQATLCKGSAYLTFVYLCMCVSHHAARLAPMLFCHRLNRCSRFLPSFLGLFRLRTCVARGFCSSTAADLTRSSKTKIPRLSYKSELALKRKKELGKTKPANTKNKLNTETRHRKIFFQSSCAEHIFVWNPKYTNQQPAHWPAHQSSSKYISRIARPKLALPPPHTPRCILRLCLEQCLLCCFFFFSFHVDRKSVV